MNEKEDRKERRWRKVGVLWKSRTGTATLSGKLDLGAIGEVDIVIVPNREKHGRQPDFHIVQSLVPREGRAAVDRDPPARGSDVQPRSALDVDDYSDIKDGEIPF